MKTPFTTEQFFSVFENYNVAVYPAQLIFILLAFIGLIMVTFYHKRATTFIAALLGIFWLWMGMVYHIQFFSPINPAAYIFGILFILQGILTLYIVIFTKRFDFYFTHNFKSSLGYFLVIFGIILYPLIGYFIRGSVEHIISLGLPCPTTILTFGFLLLADSKKLPKYILIIPTLWAIIGTTAAINYEVYQDFMLLLTALMADILIVWDARKMKGRLQLS